MTTQDLDAYRGMNYEVAEAIAPTWERRRAQIEEVAAPLREWLIREPAPRPGETILELAAGTGDTGFEAAAALGEHGTLISSDFSPTMLEAARRRGAELGVANVDYRVIDAERIDLEDDSVDGVICRFGYMLMADAAAALAETRRVLRPGGRLVLAVWRGAEQNPWISIAGRILVARGLVPPPEPGAPGIFALADDERLRALVEEAGFTVERMEDVPVRFRYRDIDDYVVRAADTSGRFAKVWREAPEEERWAIQAEIAEAFVPYAGDDGQRDAG